MTPLLIACLVCLVFLIWHTRLVRMSLGLPIAYLFSMLLQHWPGGLAHLLGEEWLLDSSATARGFQFTTIGTACFVAGVVIAQRWTRGAHGSWLPSLASDNLTKAFAVFCLIGGWVTVYGLAFLTSIPSVGAAIEHGGAIWILGALLGLCLAVERRRARETSLWLAALSVYPLLTLVFAGFLSFGSTSVFMAGAAVLVLVRSHARAYLGAALFAVFCFLSFLSYFQNRDDIRESVWGGQALEARISSSAKIITDIGWFRASNPSQVIAIDARLNQNQFAGMAAEKIEYGQTGFLYGRSVWEGTLALVPRAIWPEKPVFAGSSQMIRDMTDFEVNDQTSFGVGQVMEFYINFGIPSVVGGFLIFGWVLGWLDRNAAAAISRREFGQSFVWFLPAVAMIAPLASVSEIMGNIAAAVVAGFVWRFIWRHFERRRSPQSILSNTATASRA